MKRKGWLTTGMALLACVGMLISGPVVQAATAEAGPNRLAGGWSTAVPDVALGAGGTLQGQVVDVQGQPLGRIAVALRHRDREVARTISDESGRFRLTGLRGGVYGICVGQTAMVFRLWVSNTAPPSARPAALLVAGDQQMLGQCCPQACNSLKWWLSNPLVIAGIIGVSVAIPVAIHNAKKDDDPHSPS